MWIKGGNAVWGDATFAPDDEEGGHHTHGELISFRQTISMPLDDKDAEISPMTQAQMSNNRKTPLVGKNMTVDDAEAWILGHTPLTFKVTLPPLRHPLCSDTRMLQKMIATNYSYGIERNEETLKHNDLDHSKWTNPLEIRYVALLSRNLIPCPTAELLDYRKRRRYNSTASMAMERKPR